MSKMTAAGRRGSFIRSRLTRLGRGGGAQIEAVVGGLLRRHLAAGRQQAAGMRVIGRTVDRLDAEQLPVAIAVHRELATLDRAAQHGVVVPGGEPGDLESKLALLAPEPRQRGIGVRLPEEA